MSIFKKNKITLSLLFCCFLATTVYAQNDVRISNMGPDGDTAYGVIGSVGLALNTNSNQYLVVWAASDNTASLISGEFEIYGQLLNANTGARIGSRIRISEMGPDGDNTYAGGFAQVAYNSTDDEFLVVWAGSDNTSPLVRGEFEIFGQRIDAGGLEIGSDFQISDMGPNGDTSFLAQNPSIAYNITANEYLVSWSGIDDTVGNLQIYAQRLNAATAAEVGTNDFLVSDSLMLVDDEGPSVAFNNVNNEYIIVWSANDTGLAFDEFEIFAQRISATGSEIGTNDFRVSDMGPNNSPNYDANRPNVVHNPDDNEYLITWYGDDDTGTLVDNENEIFGQFLNAANGVEVGNNDFRISDAGPDGDTSYFSGVSFSTYSKDNKEYLVSWVASDNTGDLVAGEFEIYAQRINASTREEIGKNDFRVSDMGPDGTTAYSAGVNFTFNTVGLATIWNETQKEYLIAWVGEDNVGTLVDNEYEIFAERFDISRPDSPSIPDLKESSDSGVFNTDNITSIVTPVITGTAEVGSIVTITSSLDGVVGSFNATAGVYEVAVSTLSEGIHSITTNALSSNELKSDESSALTLIIDNSAPIPASIISPSNGDITEDTTPTISGKAEVDSRVSITIDGSQSGVTTSANSLGDWSINVSSLTEGTYSVEAFSSDLAGNAAVVSSSISFTVRVDDEVIDTEDTDGDGIVNSIDEDDDNDGILDVTEIIDGTNPLDSGSAIERLGNQVCTEWNGFLSFLTQILELRNNSTTQDAVVEISLFDINAQRTFSAGLILEPQIQLDVIINDLDGFEQNTFGLVCATILEGEDNSLGGQLMTYQFNSASYDLAFSSELTPARTGSQYLIYNTFQPSVNFADANNAVSNWAQIVNDEETPQGGSLLLFDQSGLLLETIPVALSAKQRADIDIHRVGSFKTGLAIWRPSNSNAKFRIKQNRYYNGTGGLSDLVDAVSLSAKRGTGEKIVSIFDTNDKTSTLEIANVLDVAITAEVRILNASGVLISNQTITLGPRQTAGYVINQILEDSLGSITIDSNLLSSIVVSRFEYGRSESGSLLYANPSYSVEPLRFVGSSSYNSFLGQNCRIRLANVSDQTESMNISMTRFDGVKLLNRFRFNIAAQGTTELDLCGNENQQAYGAISLEANNPGIVFAETIRQNSEQTIEVGNSLAPQVGGN